MYNKFYFQPCTSRNWALHVKLKIHGSEKLYGDGLAIWYVKDPMVLGPVFGSKDLFSGLAVTVDTYKNDNKNFITGVN